MRLDTRFAFVVVAVLTLTTIGIWVGTDRHFYTKFEVVDTVEQQVDPNDPLAGTGFYDDATIETTVTRQEFHLGMLPTPSGVLDKHALSVVSILGPIWTLVGVWWMVRRFGALRRHEDVPVTIAGRGGSKT